MIKLVKKLSMALSIVVTTMLLAGCSGKEKITFFNYGANIDNETLKAFEEEYGIKVKMDTFDDMDAMYLKIAEGNILYPICLGQ